MAQAPLPSSAHCPILLTSLAAPIAGYAEAEFYQASEQVIPGRSGTLIRQEPMRGAPLGAKAYRVLYRSTGLRGESIAVSGVVVVPPGPAPAGGRPIVAWAHPTTGIVPHCAPSLAIFGFQQIQGLRVMVRRGYIVAATDYPGLGTPGPHPYLVGTSEGRAVLEFLARGARASRNSGFIEGWHLGAFAGGTGGALRRSARQGVCPRTRACRRCCGRTGHRSRLAHAR